MTYKYPHFDHWQKYLSPIEVAFVILYTKGKDPFFTEIEDIEGGDTISIDEEEESASFNWIAQPKDPENDSVQVDVFYSWSGGYYGVEPASYDHPGDGGTSYLDSIEVEYLKIEDPDGNEIELKDNLVNFNELGFKYQNMLDLAHVIGVDHIDHEELRDSYSEEAIYRVAGRKAGRRFVWKYGRRQAVQLPEILPLEFPRKLEDKIKDIFNDKEFKLKITKKKHGL